MRTARLSWPSIANDVLQLFQVAGLSPQERERELEGASKVVALSYRQSHTAAMLYCA